MDRSVGRLGMDNTSSLPNYMSRNKLHISLALGLRRELEWDKMLDYTEWLSKIDSFDSLAR